MFTPGSTCFSNELIELAGGVNVFKDRIGSSVEITAQELIDADPDVCFISWCGAPYAKLNPENLRSRSGLELLNESARTHIIPIDEAYTGRPGPRMLEASRQMASVIQSL
jgi:iron complex transport system substrate-binding protein